MESETLGDFIARYIQSHGISAPKLAEEMNVPRSQINRFLQYGKHDKYAGRDVGEPSLDFLVRLSNATKTDICTLVFLTRPDSFIDASPSIRLLAERIKHLPVELQDLLDATVFGMAMKNIYKDNNAS